MGVDGRLMVGESLPMCRLRAAITVAAPSDLPVMITGETGTGKELVARELHRRSERRGRFIAVNVCALGDGMFEDAMFGHVRGAFTGALGDRDGYFAEADGGTLFLDEIGSLSRSAQAKLLRVVETKEFRPVGARRDVASDFRLVAASNEGLAALVARGEFRADLAYRLCGFELEVPALRTRREDLPLLVGHFLRARTVAPNGHVDVTTCALRLLESHEWPGNVRELEHLMARAMLMRTDGAAIDAMVMERAGLRGGIGGAIRASGVAEAVPSDSPERREFVDLLVRHHWDTAKVAMELGVTRKTVYARMRKHGIPVRQGRRATQLPPGAVAASAWRRSRTMKEESG